MNPEASNLDMTLTSQDFWRQARLYNLPVIEQLTSKMMATNSPGVRPFLFLQPLMPNVL
jgi:hypothetical protein